MPATQNILIGFHPVFAIETYGDVQFTQINKFPLISQQYKP